MPESSRFIAGIYNYCDSWCQKCRLSERCLVFAERADTTSPANGEALDSPRALQFLRSRLRNAMKILRWITHSPAPRRERSSTETRLAVRRGPERPGGARRESSRPARSLRRLPT